jgi:hypothetical protein
LLFELRPAPSNHWQVRHNVRPIVIFSQNLWHLTWRGWALIEHR